MPAPVKRIAVMGLFNSGSSGLAGMLHHLGVNMGRPFWRVGRDGHPLNYYEPFDLAWHLRRWWNEPVVEEKMPRFYRVKFLRQWAALQDCVGPAPVGAKHPFLSVSGPDLLEAWGSDTLFLWSYRPMEESIARLKARGWFLDTGEQMQKRLWEGVERFAASFPGMVKIPWTKLKSNPVGAANELAALVGLNPTEAQLQMAATSIRLEG